MPHYGKLLIDRFAINLAIITSEGDQRQRLVVFTSGNWVSEVENWVLDRDSEQSGAGVGFDLLSDLYLLTY